ncbi:hypothetical protein [Methylocella sp.]|uniref:hypothetical protein n=1 Tax=Methylocella sp. TaxID=1978226 RepID=UPI003783B255
MIRVAEEDEMIEIAVNATAGLSEEYRAAIQLTTSLLHMAALIRDHPAVSDADREAANLRFNRALAARIKAVNFAGATTLGRA